MPEENMCLVILMSTKSQVKGIIIFRMLSSCLGDRATLRPQH